jgi:hypothetical protein
MPNSDVIRLPGQVIASRLVRAELPIVKYGCMDSYWYNTYGES